MFKIQLVQDVQWLTVVVSAIFTLIAVWIGGWWQLRAYRQHALDTERLRLRYRVMSAHVLEFQRRAERFMGVLAEACCSQQYGDEIVGSYPYGLMNILTAAELSMSDAEYNATKRLRMDAMQRYTNLRKVLLVIGTEPGERPDEANGPLWSLCHSIERILCHLVRAVDASCEARLESRRHGSGASGEIETICAKWEKDKVQFEDGSALKEMLANK